MIRSGGPAGNPSRRAAPYKAFRPSGESPIGEPHAGCDTLTRKPPNWHKISENYQIQGSMMSFDDFVQRLTQCLEAAFGPGRVKVQPVGGYGNHGRQFTVGSCHVILNPGIGGLNVNDALIAKFVAKFDRLMRPIPQGNRLLLDCARQS